MRREIYKTYSVKKKVNWTAKWKRTVPANAVFLCIKSLHCSSRRGTRQNGHVVQLKAKLMPCHHRVFCSSILIISWGKQTSFSLPHFSL